MVRIGLQLTTLVTVKFGTKIQRDVPFSEDTRTPLGLYHAGYRHCWRRGVVASVVRRMNEVTLRRARLVLGWVAVFGRVYHHGM